MTCNRRSVTVVLSTSEGNSILHVLWKYFRLHPVDLRITRIMHLLWKKYFYFNCKPRGKIGDRKPGTRDNHTCCSCFLVARFFILLSWLLTPNSFFVFFILILIISFEKKVSKLFFTLLMNLFSIIVYIFILYWGKYFFAYFKR